ncbi:MAG: trypsin-like peptidase domain-containing protein [Bacteroidetes bacterium]|uniref:Trypsin-like peptidase domain-containing protein n=1 Tax=Candidatus Merdivivens pullistercoris TaxID=2840873 RepID=A0A9D9I3Q8_9BACT|nr:trypsin-like peptidase domain-containing protein [Candidatus Merdivivens pullistercoris]
MKKRHIMLTVLLSVAAGIIAAYFTVDYMLSGHGADKDSVPVSPAGVTRTVNLSADDYPDFTYAAETAVEAVVSVTVIKRSEEYVPSGILGLFFGYGHNVPMEQIGSGSGVIMSPDGYIVTNNHVVEGATDIEVTLNDNSTYPARLVGTDPATDVAVIKIDKDGLPALVFADSDQLRIGEWVLAIGSPYQLKSTITAGIVSAKGRTMPNYTGEFRIESFIQTDAAVNPGNSGGALVDKTGALVGINTAIVSETGAYSGYSFAIPSNMARKVAEDIINYGGVRRAALGITMQNIDKKIASRLKLSGQDGVYITGIVSGGAADRAGLRSGDVILGIDSAKVDDIYEAREIISSHAPGDTSAFTVWRGGRELSREVIFDDSSRLPSLFNKR